MLAMTSTTTYALILSLAVFVLSACGDGSPVVIEGEGTSSPGSCETYCALRNHSCTASCQFAESSGGTGIGAGAGHYYTGSDFWIIERFDTCDTPIRETISNGYTLFEWECCCEVFPGAPADAASPDADVSVDAS
jgi:hypothetical protein